MSIRLKVEWWGEDDRRLKILALDSDGHDVGRIDGEHRGKEVVIESVDLDEGMRRQKIGTRMYEAAAKAACERHGVPIASDTTRSGYSDAFWSKQVAKGRARCVAAKSPGPRPKSFDSIVVGRGGCSHYVLTCPAGSLDGLKKKRKR